MLESKFQKASQLYDAVALRYRRERWLGQFSVYEMDKHKRDDLDLFGYIVQVRMKRPGAEKRNKALLQQQSL